MQLDKSISVTVSNYGRKFLYMRYKDPLTGKNVAKSTGTANMKEAVKIAAKWEAELQEGRYKHPSRVTWAEFRERYETERLQFMAKNTADKVGGVFNAVEELIEPHRLSQLTTGEISKFQRKLREERDLADQTVSGMLAHLKASLRWAGSVGILAEIPAINIPNCRRAGKVMRGRPITDNEFSRMLDAVPDVLNDLDATPRWEWFLRGLWWSGLRLSEAIDLSWNDSRCITVDTSGRFPMFRIPAPKQKSRIGQVLPIAPEFAEMLSQMPDEDRDGKVFRLGRRNSTQLLTTLSVSRLIGAIGKAAGVVVNDDPKKYASAQDLRRSFGERWSKRVMPFVLRDMMRHRDLETTFAYYVGQNSERSAEDIYAAFQQTISFS